MDEQQREMYLTDLVEAQYERNSDSWRIAARLEKGVRDRVSANEFEELQREAIDRFNRRAEPVTN